MRAGRQITSQLFVKQAEKATAGAPPDMAILIRKILCAFAGLPCQAS